MKNFIIFLFLSIGTVFYAQTFENMDAGLPNFYDSITAFGDIDGDGDMDLYLSGDSDIGATGGLYIYDAEASTYTLSTTSGIPSLTLGSARWSDIDNDGDLDFLLQGFDNPLDIGFTDVFLNDAGLFTALNLGLPPLYMGEVAFANINNDEYIDIAITGFYYNSENPEESESFTKLYKNNGDTTFTHLPQPTPIPAYTMGRFKFADYNNDGYDDFVISGEYGVNALIYTNNQDETFVESGIVLEAYTSIGNTEWVDYNADGNIDLIISGYGGYLERNTILFKQNDDGDFIDIEAGFPGLSHSAIEWADFDNDGDLDVFLTGTETTPGEGNYTYHIYNNDGGDLFSISESAVLSASYYGDADIADIDGDGKIDIVISGYDENDEPKSNVFMNTTTVGIDDEFLTSFQIYPNPSKDKKITLSFDSIATQDNEITIYTLTGAKVFYSKIVNTKEIDLSNLNTGIYMVEIKSDNKMTARKLILE